MDVSASIPTNKLPHMFPHLSELNFPELDYKWVELLLGSDLHQAYLLKEVLKGEPGQPCGLHTSLGWTIYGKDSGDKEIMGSSRLMVNFIDHRDDEESVDKCCALWPMILMTVIMLEVWYLIPWTAKEL